MIHWEGAHLGGEYALGQYLGEGDDPRGAFYAATRSSGERVLVKLLRTDAPKGQERLLLWRRTVQLQHPNLLRLLDCGRDAAVANGEGCLYAVFEWPDDRLSTALEHGPLSEAEARELLEAALAALRYLHAQGLVHGSLDAAHVLAVGNAIKLATDNLYEPDTGEYTRAHDIGALGALLHRVLTGHEIGDGADCVEIAEPLAGMIRNMVNAEAAGGGSQPKVSRVAEPAEAVHREPALLHGRGSVMEEEAPRSLDPKKVEAPVPEALTGRAGKPKLPLWAWPVSLAAVVGCIVMVVDTPAPKPHPKATTPPVYAPEPASALPPAAAPAAAGEPAEAAAPRGRTVWRVIAYTYATPNDARKQVLKINRVWPGFEAEVFTPKGKNHAPYLVALGGRMDRLEAARVLQKARSRGLPRDTFMLNFSD